MDLDKLQADIDAARASYLAERDLLVRTAGWIYADGPAAADAIEGLAEELGPSKAVGTVSGQDRTCLANWARRRTDQLIADQSDAA